MNRRPDSDRLWRVLTKSFTKGRVKRNSNKIKRFLACGHIKIIEILKVLLGKRSCGKPRTNIKIFSCKCKNF